MTAPIVYTFEKDTPIPLEYLYPEEDAEDNGTSGHSVEIVRDTYRKAGQDDGTLGGTLWEREAERATLRA